MGPCYVTNKVHILEHWTAHFSQLLNRPSAVDEQAPNDLPQRPLIPTLDETPMREETVKAIGQLQIGKLQGQMESLLKSTRLEVSLSIIDWLTSLFQAFSERGELPQDLKDVYIIHRYKNKGEKATCNNHRCISLLNIAEKILTRIFQNRILEYLVHNVVSESKCGFR